VAEIDLGHSAPALSAFHTQNLKLVVALFTKTFFADDAVN
jgi:hypothetical protein